jgi:ABC-type phosphate transport system substrate-binding protein
MKTNYFYQVLFALFISSSVFASENAAKEPIVISGTKFTYPLIEKWIAEYEKVNPNANIQLAAKTNGGQVADLNIIAHQPTQNELQPNQEIIYAGRYALLPVTNNNNPILAAVAKKGLNKKELDKLFFEVVDYDSDEPAQKSKFRANIYSRDNQACASTALAGYYGHQSSEIRGKKVFGDDIYLLSAIKKDSIGLTYNNLGYLYDVNSRNLKEGIALLPLDLKKEAKSIQSGNLDEVLSVLESTKVETIPVEKIGFIYSQQNAKKELSAFLKWVLTDGQKFNHNKGFLNLDKQALAEQESRLSDRFLTLK